MSEQSEQHLTEATVGLVAEWLATTPPKESRSTVRAAQRLRHLMADPQGVAFTMKFVDRVFRPDQDQTAAHQLRSLVRSHRLPTFLSAWDKLLLRVGSGLAPVFPWLVIPLARRRMRQLVGHLLVDAEPQALGRYLSERRKSGFLLNINLLGEAVLGEAEADRRLEATAQLIDRPDIDYVSVKVSAVASQLNYWDWEGSRVRVLERLRVLFRRAQATQPTTFLNLDMEEYRDLELTVAVFQQLLDEPEFHKMTAGIVLQAYLPDSFPALQDLTRWAGKRVDNGGGEIKIRLVKGANLAMEQVEATLRGWEQAPYSSKAQVDANFKRLVDWALDSHRGRAVRVGIGSHNLFDTAWAHLLSVERGVADRVDLEMLQGMAPALAQVIMQSAKKQILLYTPIVASESFDTAIGYLFRRLEENAGEGNFLRVLFSLHPGSPEFEQQADAFRRAVAQRHNISDRPRRHQLRPGGEAIPRGEFSNEPDTDPALPTNRVWAREVLSGQPGEVCSPPVVSVEQLAAWVAAARISGWGSVSAGTRQEILHKMADLLAGRRGDLIAAMVGEGRKTFAQADPEVSEAIDFARFYGDRAVELDPCEGAAFRPLGVVAVFPPWNFPVAIPTGGVTAALAAGNRVLIKPSGRTGRCAEIMVECAWEAGVPRDALAFVTLPEGIAGQQTARFLIDSVDGVILTGSADTARLFHSWRPELRLFAETSGKNAMVITEHADIDQAVAHLVDSAFGHAGQKCSAASLAICVGSVYYSERFRRQLRDAVESLAVGPPEELSSVVGPVIAPVEGKLHQALTSLEPGEEWLVAPIRLDEQGALWRPGVRMGVAPGSWFHVTECFGPVLGMMFAPDLASAVLFSNAVDFGLTGGIHSLDPAEVDFWLERVQVGNAYVNREITGAIVQRQPFGGWKQSNVGPGAKAGGPNYVRQLGVWEAEKGVDMSATRLSDQHWWETHFGLEHDPSGLFCEANIFRYRPLAGVAIRVSADGCQVEASRCRAAAHRCGTPVVVSQAAQEPDEVFAARLGNLGVERVRMVGSASAVIRSACRQYGVHLVEEPVTSSGRVELLHFLKEQSVSRTLHRFGNLVGIS